MARSSLTARSFAEDDRASTSERESVAVVIAEERAAVLIVNARSRSGVRAYEEARQRLADAGMTLHAAHPVEDADRLPRIVREEIGRGRRYIIVGGGDGTIASVVGDLAYSDAVLGVLPLGTANSFARTVGIPLDLAGAVEVLTRGKVAKVDLGRIDDRYFANGSSIGMPAIVGRVTPPRLKRWLGRAAYALAGAMAFRQYRPFRCHIVVDGAERSFQALEVRIASGAYQGGVVIAEEAEPDDGLIDARIVTGSSKWMLVREWARIGLRAPFPPAEIVALTAREMVIDAVPPQRVAVDGEVVASTPLRISVARRALRLMVPRSFDDGGRGAKP